MKTFNLTVLCQAYYTSSIEVPDDFTREQALEYARKHLDLCPIDSPLEYISDSDELDDENCDFEQEGISCLKKFSEIFFL